MVSSNHPHEHNTPEAEAVVLHIMDLAAAIRQRLKQADSAIEANDWPETPSEAMQCIAENLSVEHATVCISALARHMGIAR